MRCNKTNACICNPNRKKQSDDISRNYSRQPILEHEHGRCPYRIDGKCDNKDMQIRRIKLLRQTVKDYRVYADKIKHGVKCDSFIIDTVKKYGFKVEMLTNPKDSYDRGMYVFGLTGYKKGTVKEYLEGLIAYQLNNIDSNVIQYKELLKKFSIKADMWSSGIVIKLYGDMEDFNDETIYNWESEFEYDTRWYGKEFMIGNVKVQINIREQLPPKKDGELNTER